MVHGEQQHVLVAGQPQQPAADEWSGGKIEGGHSLQPGQAAHAFLAFVRINVSQIDLCQRESSRGLSGGCNHRHGPAALFGKRGAQHLVPADNLLERVTQRVDAQRPAQADGRRNVIERVAALFRALEPVEEPEALLAEREGQRLAGSGRGREFWRSRLPAVGSRPRRRRPPGWRAQAPRTARRSGSSTPKASRMRETSCVASKECPPKSKKLSRCTDPLHAEQVRPDARQDFFGGRRGREIGRLAALVQAERLTLGLRERAPVDFAVRRQG